VYAVDQPTKSLLSFITYRLAEDNLSARLGVLVGTLKSRVHRARDLLRWSLRLEVECERRGLSTASVQRWRRGLSPDHGGLIPKNIRLKIRAGLQFFAKIQQPIPTSVTDHPF
jgi:hypothetical protein